MLHEVKGLAPKADAGKSHGAKISEVKNGRGEGQKFVFMLNKH